jgi:hypothetical protein
MYKYFWTISFLSIISIKNIEAIPCPIIQPEDVHTAIKSPKSEYTLENDGSTWKLLSKIAFQGKKPVTNVELWRNDAESLHDGDHEVVCKYRITTPTVQIVVNSARLKTGS